MTALMVHSPAELLALAGQDLGYGPWRQVTQQAIDGFAQATGDRQWIHCDPDRARRESPFGECVAHGFFTLALCPQLVDQLLVVPAAKLVVNYGTDRVRFPQAVVAGSHLRLWLKVEAVQQIDNACDATYLCTIEVQGAAKPACVAQWRLRYFF